MQHAIVQHSTRLQYGAEGLHLGHDGTVSAAIIHCSAGLSIQGVEAVVCVWQVDIGRFQIRADWKGGLCLLEASGMDARMSRSGGVEVSSEFDETRSRGCGCGSIL
jgi:hypothetical protein